MLKRPVPHRPRVSLTAWLLCALLALSACGLPQPAAHVRVVFDAQGGVTLNGVPTTVAQLPDQLAAQRANNDKLVVEIHGSRLAKPEAVQATVAAVRQARATVAFVHPESAGNVMAAPAE